MQLIKAIQVTLQRKPQTKNADIYRMFDSYPTEQVHAAILEARNKPLQPKPIPNGDVVWCDIQKAFVMVFQSKINK